MVSKCTWLGCATLTATQPWTASSLVGDHESQAEACSNASGLIPPKRLRLSEPPLIQLRWPITCDCPLSAIDGCHCRLLNALRSPPIFPSGIKTNQQRSIASNDRLHLLLTFNPHLRKSLTSRLESLTSKIRMTLYASMPKFITL